MKPVRSKSKAGCQHVWQSGFARGGIFVKGDFDQYTRYSQLVTEIIADKAPVFEKSSIDEFYINMTGMDRFFGVNEYTKQLREKVINRKSLYSRQRSECGNSF